MAVQAELTVHHRGCVSEKFHGATTMAQISGDQRGDRRADLFVLHAADAAGLDEALRWCEEYVHNRADVIDRQGASVVFRGINSAGGVVDAIRHSDCSILWPVVYRDGLEYYNLLAPDRQALRGVLRTLEGHGEVVVRSVADVAAGGIEAMVHLSDLTSPLTKRQMDVLLLALRRGYYRTPRRATSAALAAELGVAPSTFAEHLRKAERSLLTKFGDLAQHHEVLARGATKRPGRPRGVSPPTRRGKPA